MVGQLNMQGVTKLHNSSTVIQARSFGEDDAQSESNSFNKSS